ncbi:phosphatase, partial [Streptomyces sp. NPDC059627]
MPGVTRWFQSRRGPAIADGSGGPDAAPSAPLRALRTAAAGIGTSLDESTTCTELTRAAVRLAGGGAAVL